MTATYLSENQSEFWLLCPGFDDLLLTGQNQDPSGRAFTIRAMAEGFDPSTPEPIDVAVQRWMTDGAAAATQGHENREPTFVLKVSAASSVSLALGESELVKRSGRPVQLKWVPPEGRDRAPASIFEVWTWHLQPTFDIDAEMRLTRAYTFTSKAKPWTRSENLTTVAAVTTSVSPTITVIDPGTSISSSTFRWTAPFGVPSIVRGTAVNTHATFASETSFGLALLRTGTVTGLGSLPYLVIDWALTTAASALKSSTRQVWLDRGAPLTAVATLGTTTYYQLPAGTTGWGSLTVELSGTTRKNSGNSTAVALEVADVFATNAIAAVGSHKQLARSISVGGSVPTSGSIKIAATAALGTTLVYTCRDRGTNYSPSLRQFRLAGSSLTAASDAVSGQRETLVTNGVAPGFVVYNIPANSLPQASYVVLGRFYCDTAGKTLTATFSAGALADSVSAVGTMTWAAAGYVWSVLGVLDLPNPPVPVESNVVQAMTLIGAGTGNTWVDDIWLLDVTNGTVTMVSAGTNTRLWLDAPDADPVRNLPAIYLGTADDRSNAFGGASKVLSRGDHDLYPEGTYMMTVCEANDATVTASFYARWHTHAAA